MYVDINDYDRYLKELEHLHKIEKEASEIRRALLAFEDPDDPHWQGKLSPENKLMLERLSLLQNVTIPEERKALDSRISSILQSARHAGYAAFLGGVIFGAFLVHVF